MAKMLMPFYESFLCKDDNSLRSFQKRPANTDHRSMFSASMPKLFDIPFPYWHKTECVNTIQTWPSQCIANTSSDRGSCLDHPSFEEHWAAITSMEESKLMPQ
eukprot:scaffold176149_cov42-Prasinocladus_malaysianus.AAC.1